MTLLDEGTRLAKLQTELRNPDSADIDRLSTLELCALLNKQDSTIHSAVASCIPAIAKAIDSVSQRVRHGGRLFYIGAGTSGRLGVLDASEIPPTYSAPSDQFVAMVAGGDYALRHAKEGAEDDRLGAQMDLEPYSVDPKVDSLIGIASSGRTPYVLGGLAWAKELGCNTIGLVCVSPSEVAVEGNADHLIAAVTGPEVVTGSTRMRAGTATKLILNMISTGVMIKLGKTYGNLMVDLRATNHKLRQRARNVLRAVADPRRMKTDAELDLLLEECHGSVKLACASLATGLPVAEAEQRLMECHGVLAHVLDGKKAKNGSLSAISEVLVLCVDAGGSSCRAVIMSTDGQVGKGSSGPCNVSVLDMQARETQGLYSSSSNMGIDASMASITTAIHAALAEHPLTRGRSLRATIFTSAWVAIAGYDRPLVQMQVDKALEGLLSMRSGNDLTVTTDIDLLSASCSSDSGIDSAIVLVAGTGSIAMRYQRKEAGLVRTGRAGGWGHLLGDDGSGYSLGREGARAALFASDLRRSSSSTSESSKCLTPLAKAITEHVQHLNPSCSSDDVLSGILTMSTARDPVEAHVLPPTRKIAQLAEVVLSMVERDDEAREIVDAGAVSLSKLVALLACADELDLRQTALILGGGLMQNAMYREKICETISRTVGQFVQVQVISEPVLQGAKQLLAQLVARDSDTKARQA